MREFVVKRGAFIGTHNIYESEKECIKYEKVDHIRKPWHDPDSKEGEWCVMDDGFVAQLLKRYKLPDARGTDVYRFCFGSRACYWRKRTNTRATPLFYTTNPSANKSALVSQGYDRELGSSLDSRKRLWVELVAGGMAPIEATENVYKGNVTLIKLTKSRIIAMTNRLIKDTKVRKLLVKELKTFKEEIEEQLIEQTGLTITEKIAVEIAKIASVEAKNMKEMVAKIKLLLDIGQITGQVPEKSSNKKLSNAVEVNHEEVAPPLLGEKD